MHDLKVGVCTTRGGHRQHIVRWRVPALAKKGLSRLQFRDVGFDCINSSLINKGHLPLLCSDIKVVFECMWFGASDS